VRTADCAGRQEKNVTADTIGPAQADPPAAEAIDGDAATYLEELLHEQPDALPRQETSGSIVKVELVGPHLRLAGGIALGRFRRLSDVLNHHEGLLELFDATVLRRNGTPTKVTTPAIWVNPTEVTIVGEAIDADPSVVPNDQRIAKERHPLVVVTPGHTLTGDVYTPIGADLSVFIESVEPAFIPMTEVRTRSLADRRIVTRYSFAVLNRRHIVAATGLPAGMTRSGWI
jgi:hypothetical protein